MPQAKRIVTQARIGNEVFYTHVSEGKKSKGAALIACADLITARGVAGEIRQQETGAKGWAVYTYEPGAMAAHLNTQSDWRRDATS